MDNTVVLIACALVITVLFLASAVFLYERIKRFINNRLTAQQDALLQQLSRVTDLAEVIEHVKEDQRVLAREVHKIGMGLSDIEQLNEQQAVVVQQVGRVPDLVNVVEQVKEDQRILAREVHRIDMAFRDLEQLSKQQVAALGRASTINDVANIVDVIGQVKADQRVLAQEVYKIDTGFQGIAQHLNHMRAYLAHQKSVYDSTAETIEILERKLVGAKSRGDFGEELVQEKLIVLGDWIEYKARFSHAREVEFALRLPNGRLIPIDSKWTATNLLNYYGQTKDEAVKRRIRDEIKKEVGRRAVETRKYLEDHRTIGFCIAAVPDIVFDLSHDIQSTLIKLDVVLISYSLLVPYLLMLIKTIVSHEQAERLLKADHVLKRTKLQIEKIQEYIDRRVVTAFDALKIQQAQHYTYNGQIQQATQRIQNIRSELDTLYSQLPNNIIDSDHGKLLVIPQDIHQHIRAVYESLLDIARENDDHRNGSDT